MSFSYRVHIMGNDDSPGHAFIELKSPAGSVFYQLDANDAFNRDNAIGRSEIWKYGRNPARLPDEAIELWADGKITATLDIEDFNDEYPIERRVASQFVGITEDQYIRMAAYADGKIAVNDGLVDYDVINESCITFVRDVIRAAGIQTPLASLFTAQDVAKTGDIWIWYHGELNDVLIASSPTSALMLMLKAYAIEAGIDVGNITGPVISVPKTDVEETLGHPINYTDEDVEQIAAGIANGTIRPQIGIANTEGDQFTAPFASGDRIVMSGDHSGLSVSTMGAGFLQQILTWETDGRRSERYFDPQDNELWSNRWVDIDSTGHTIQDMRDYKTVSDQWLTNHTFPTSNLWTADENFVTDFSADITRSAIHSGAIEESAPNPIVFERNTGVFNLGNYVITPESPGIATVQLAEPTGFGFDFSGSLYGSAAVFSIVARFVIPTNILDIPFSFLDFMFPVVLDLDGNGLKLQPRSDSNVYYNADGDASRERTAWVGPGDGLLVVDLDNDGKITRDELAFADRTADPNDTDLAALATLYDANSDRELNGADAVWNQLRVWVDSNQNGVTDGGELRTLGSLGITRIGLESDRNAFALSDGSRINGFSSFTMNGATRAVADAALAFQKNGFTRTVDGEFTDYTSDDNSQRRRYFDVANTAGYEASPGFVFDTGQGYGNDGILGGRHPDIIRSENSTKSLTMYGAGGNDEIRLGSGNDLIDGGTGADKLLGGDGDDTIYFDDSDLIVDGGGQHDTGILTSSGGITISLVSKGLESLISNGGNDNITANAASAAYIDGRGGNDTITGSPFGDMVVGGTGDDAIDGGEGGDLLSGGAGNDALRGGNGDDVILGGAGSDFIDGAGGLDTATFTGAASGYSYVLYNGEILVAARGRSDRERLISVERLKFSDRTINAGDVPVFRPLEYIASYPDLVAGEGASEQNGVNHFLNFGFAEGRTITFNGLEYIASWPDLLADPAYGIDRELGARHFIQEGYGQGRTISFNGWEYLASWADVAANSYYGASRDRGTEHFIVTGRAEGRQVSFDGLRYVASYPDLIAAKGADRSAGAEHFVRIGRGEGRTVSFDPSAYLFHNPELVPQFGGNLAAATAHYITAGHAAGLLWSDLTGGPRNDTLRGTPGADTLAGLAGNDTYYINHAGDLVVEHAGGGHDTALSWLASYALPAEVEDLILLFDTAATNGSGNSLANTITGNAAANTLSGGAGADTLTGNAGNDVFVHAPGFGADTVTDFSPGDRIDLSAHGAIRTLADVLARAAQAVADTVIDFGGGDTLTLRNVTRANLTRGDFILQPPSINSNGGGDAATVWALENTTAVTTVTALGEGLGYSIVGGPDRDRFQINAASGVLAFAAAPDFEAPSDADGNNSYVLQVQASDGYRTDLQTITVHVTDFAPTITGTGAGEPLDGTAENDNILGLGGNDILNGKAGRDTLTGGPGADVFRLGGLAHADALAGVVDRITDYNRGNSGLFDLAEGDQVDLSAMLAAGYNLGAGLPAGTLVRAIEYGTRVNLQVDTDGAANGVNWLTVGRLDGYHAGMRLNVVLDPGLPAGLPVNVVNLMLNVDFNGDGKADIAWQHDNGAPGVWLMNGTSETVRGPALQSPGTAWKIRTAGDFDGDGKADLLWQHDDGSPAVWLMDGTVETLRGNALGNPGAAWHVMAAADFNGDGKDDLLWQHDSGMAAVWLMDGTAEMARGPALSVAPGWRVRAATDFNADGKADILWQHDNGWAAVWLMDGTAETLRGGVLAPANASWRVKDAADFDGDGKADILWQSDANGLGGIWLMNGTAETFRGPGLATASPGWRAISAADFNADAKADILWQHDSGMLGVWLMNGVTEQLRGPGLSQPDLSWHIAAPVILDLDGDGIEVAPLGLSAARFDMDGRAGREQTAWIVGADGLLAIDLAGDGGAGPDGVIDQTREIVFTRWAPGTTSDMAALRQAFDTNRNGALDAGDARWSEFRVWQDADGDGVSQPGEVRTLDALGIASIDLEPAGPAQALGDGSVIQGVSRYTRNDGTTGAAGDVALAYAASGDALLAMLENLPRTPGGTPVADDGLAQLIQAMAIHSADRGSAAPRFVTEEQHAGQMLATAWQQ